MSKFEEKVNESLDAAKTLGIKVDSSLLTKVAKALGPSIYKVDSALVASSDKTEIERLKKNFLEGKLGSSDDSKNNAAIAHATKAFGSSRKKYRILFYTLCVEFLGKSGIYK
ncbi:MAG: DUF2853 family protein [Saprospiraceae bacterium]|nr:DUF2853 family protein [Saprospiraceae bacterium]